MVTTEERNGVPETLFGYCSFKSQQDLAGNFTEPSGFFKRSTVLVMFSNSVTIASICTSMKKIVDGEINNNNNNNNNNKPTINQWPGLAPFYITGLQNISNEIFNPKLFY